MLLTVYALFFSHPKLQCRYCRERERTLMRPPPRYLIGCLSRVAAVHDGAATMAEVGHVTKEDLEICAPHK
jgi:hypothetical protein